MLFNIFFFYIFKFILHSCEFIKKKKILSVFTDYDANDEINTNNSNYETNNNKATNNNKNITNNKIITTTASEIIRAYLK